MPTLVHGMPASPRSPSHTQAEDFHRLRYFCLSGVAGALVNAVGYVLAGNPAVAVLSAGLAMVVLGLWRWMQAGDDPLRLGVGLHLTVGVVLVVLLAASLLSGGTTSVASWYFGILPMSAAFFTSVRATMVWMGLCMASILGMALWEQWLPGMSRAEPAVLQVTGHLTLILFSTLLGLAARLSRDRFVAQLACSLAAEQRAKRDADAARMEAEKASRAKSEFLAVMSHEIRTPLNGILGLTQLMQSGASDSTRTHYLRLMSQSGETLLHLVNNLLDFSKIEAGQLELELLTFHPRQVVEETLELVRECAREKGLTLTCVPFDAPAVCGDPARLSQVLLNLLNNAVKFTLQGSVVLRCLPLADPCWLRFEIADTGIGIDAEARARLFQPFVQAEASTTRRFGGTGLGLSICKRLVEAMGGSLGVDSTPGRGSTFWLELPLPLASQVPSALAVAAPESNPVPRPLLTARVLLAEDNPVNQMVARGMLQHFGIEVAVVADGEAAVAATRDGMFDLILMDCHMPVMDGLAASRQIRAAPDTQHLPIVALTAAASDADRNNCLAAGMNDFIAKPVRMSELRRVLERWLARGPGPESDTAC